ncbi:HalOD1 output domain-containing protein [Natronomonas marina]|jgi:hypothetical protein|uniref:HalOD1 output domain-containing protein n=1 Tax=Natronomonas marina TaxID=2961939 RepID=UPI0020C986D0|nr:HalOD1 output domain-containing protein [Natronomonas marina]
MENGAERSELPDDENEVRTQYDWERTTPSTAVVETVASAADADATDIEPLYGTLDPDALDSLIAGSTDDRSDITVSFTFAGELVTLHGTGEVVARPAYETDRIDG